jgi:hypothetical protein
VKSRDICHRGAQIKFRISETHETDLSFSRPQVIKSSNCHQVTQNPTQSIVDSFVDQSSTFYFPQIRQMIDTLCLQVCILISHHHQLAFQRESSLESRLPLDLRPLMPNIPLLSSSNFRFPRSDSRAVTLNFTTFSTLLS